MDSTVSQDLDALFDQLYSEHYPELVVFFGRRGLDPETSRDLAQKAMLRIYRGLEGFKGESSHRTWILRIAANTWKNWVRDHRLTSKRGVREGSLEEALEQGREIAEGQGFWPSQSNDPERQAVEKQARERILLRVPDLPKRQRQCLVRWLEGRSYREIVDELGVSIQTVRASLHKAKARLERELRHDFRPADSASPAGGES